MRNAWSGRGTANMQNNGAAGSTVLKPVELGINNDDYAEVISGLQEGESVVLPALATSSGQNNATMRAGFGGMGFGGIGAVQAGGNTRTFNQSSQGNQGANRR